MAGSYGFSVRTANGTPCYFATLVCHESLHACRAAVVSRACLRVRMPWPPVRLCKAGMPPFSCCILPLSCVSVACAHVVSCIFPVPSTLPLLHAAPFLACQSLACVLLAVYSRCSLATWMSCISFVACCVALRPWGKACPQATGFTRAALIQCLPPGGTLATRA